MSTRHPVWCGKCGQGALWSDDTYVISCSCGTSYNPRDDKTNFVPKEGLGQTVTDWSITCIHAGVTRDKMFSVMVERGYSIQECRDALGDSNIGELGGKDG